ncbi:hypothetical protein Vadar_031949 [Vaccinium darrowii]|nr:hypothetical protein Vadar_031949 [Vaccinium darrowii]
MDDYIDEIRSYDQKLQAIGYQIDDDDLVFYALKGLPEECKHVRAALNAKGDTLFSELATILKNEEYQILRDEDLSAPKVFPTNQTYAGTTTPVAHQRQSVESVSTSVPSGGVLGPVPQFYSVPMYQSSQPSGPYFPAQNNRGFSTGQNNRGGRGSNNKMECQICGKTIHTALYCYHRQNHQYQPPPQFSKPKRGDSQPWNGGNQSWNGGNQPWNGGGNQPWNGGSGNEGYVPFVSQTNHVPNQRSQQSFAMVTPQSNMIAHTSNVPSQTPNVIAYGGQFPSTSSHNYQMQGGSAMLTLSQAPP